MKAKILGLEWYKWPFFILGCLVSVVIVELIVPFVVFKNMYTVWKYGELKEQGEKEVK